MSIVHLYLAGNFNSWNPSDSAWEMQPSPEGSYTIRKRLPKGIYQFKITRGNWSQVECSAGGTPIENRKLNLTRDTVVTLAVAGWQDSFPPPEKTHTASPEVQVMSPDFVMPQLGRTRRIWIYLPKDYSSSPKKYPVIYMQDGQNLFDDYTAGYGEWGVDEIMDHLPVNRQCIIVGIDHGGKYRITEYDPYQSKFGKGRGADYAAFVAHTLKPYIDSRYRTMADAKHTTIAGSSMGGLIAMYTALKYPRIFGNAGVFSPSFWIAPAIYRFADKQSIPSYARFYFVCGDAESDTMVAGMKKMAATMLGKVSNSSNVQVSIVKGAIHNEKQWHQDFPGFYKWLIRLK